MLGFALAKVISTVPRKSLNASKTEQASSFLSVEITVEFDMVERVRWWILYSSAVKKKAKCCESFIDLDTCIERHDIHRQKHRNTLG